MHYLRRKTRVERFVDAVLDAALDLTQIPHGHAMLLGILVGLWLVSAGVAYACASWVWAGVRLHG